MGGKKENWISLSGFYYQRTLSQAIYKILGLHYTAEGIHKILKLWLKPVRVFSLWCSREMGVEGIDNEKLQVFCRIIAKNWYFQWGGRELNPNANYTAITQVKCMECITLGELLPSCPPHSIPKSCSTAKVNSEKLGKTVGKSQSWKLWRKAFERGSYSFSRPHSIRNFHNSKRIYNVQPIHNYLLQPVKLRVFFQ